MGISMRAALAASVVFVLFTVLAGQATAGASMPQLVATGSSYAGVAISQWEGYFNETDGGDVNFTVSSSVIGLNDFCNKTVDIGASDLSYAAGASACSPSQVPYPYQYVPDVGGALGFEYNLKTGTGKRITNLVLNPATIAGIFTGAIHNWDDASIAAPQPRRQTTERADHCLLPRRSVRGERPVVELPAGDRTHGDHRLPNRGNNPHHPGSTFRVPGPPSRTVARPACSQ